MKPVGLTRAEEALQERREERVRVVAPQGAVRCQVNVGDGCVAAAVYRVVLEGRARDASLRGLCVASATTAARSDYPRRANHIR